MSGPKAEEEIIMAPPKIESVTRLIIPLPLPNNKNIPFKIKTNKRAKEKGRGK